MTNTRIDLFQELRILITEARQRESMSLETLSEQLGDVSVESLRRFEEGNGSLGCDTFFAIANVLNMDPFQVIDAFQRMGQLTFLEEAATDEQIPFASLTLEKSAARK